MNIDDLKKGQKLIITQELIKNNPCRHMNVFSNPFDDESNNSGDPFIWTEYSHVVGACFVIKAICLPFLAIEYIGSDLSGYRLQIDARKFKFSKVDAEFVRALQPTSQQREEIQNLKNFMEQQKCQRSV